MHRFQCNICEYKAGQKSALTKHNESVHEGIKPFKCKICDYKTAQNSKLEKHTESVHEGIKPFKCIVLNLKYFRPSWIWSKDKAVYLIRYSLDGSNYKDTKTLLKIPISPLVPE